MKLPPLLALRAFEAVARTGSVRDAAHELAVTSAAVSQQIRGLEEHLGLKLFDRSIRMIRPNEAGRQYQEVIGRALRSIEQATLKLRPLAEQVRITAVPSLATLWLSPRLARFSRQFPGIQVSIDADPNVVDMRLGSWDLALRDDQALDRHCEGVRLMSKELVAVAAPAYLASVTVRKQVQWEKVRLLHEETSEAWTEWFARRKIAHMPQRGQYFSHAMMALAAAAGSEGVALVASVLVQQALAQGSLVMASPHRSPTDRAYWLCWPKPAYRPMTASVVAFRDWLLTQAGSTN